MLQARPLVLTDPDGRRGYPGLLVFLWHKEANINYDTASFAGMTKKPTRGRLHTYFNAYGAVHIENPARNENEDEAWLEDQQIKVSLPV